MTEGAVGTNDNSLRWFARLPSGRHGLPPEFIARFQEQRLAMAVAQVAHEEGPGALTVARIVAAAGVSRRTIYEHFENKTGCFEFACEEARRRLFGPVEAARDSPDSWLERVSGAIGALLDAVVENPLLAELCLVHSPAMAGGGRQSSYQAGIETFTELMRGGREAGRRLRAEDAGFDPPPQAEEFIACAIVSVISLRVERGEIEDLPGLRGELVRLAASPFLGVEEAARYGQGLEAA